MGCLVPFGRNGCVGCVGCTLPLLVTLFCVLLPLKMLWPHHLRHDHSSGHVRRSDVRSKPQRV